MGLEFSSTFFTDTSRLLSVPSFQVNLYQPGQVMLSLKALEDIAVTVCIHMTTLKSGKVFSSFTHLMPGANRYL